MRGCAHAARGRRSPLQVPVAVAANICGIGVNLLAPATLPTGPVDCDALAQAVANG